MRRTFLHGLTTLFFVSAIVVPPTTSFATQIGLGYLQDAGYTNTHHRPAKTETIVGHATHVTGADTSVHGPRRGHIKGSGWCTRSKKRRRCP